MSVQELKQAFESVDTSALCRLYLWTQINHEDRQGADIGTKWEIFYGVSESEEETWLRFDKCIHTIASLILIFFLGATISTRIAVLVFRHLIYIEFI
jgi:hypothetical protein